MSRRTDHHRARRRHDGPRHCARRRRVRVSRRGCTTSATPQLGKGTRPDRGRASGRPSSSGKATAADADAASARLTTTSDLAAALDGRGLRHRGRARAHRSEAAADGRHRSPCAGDSAIVATNTSALSITEMAGASKNPVARRRACTSSTPCTSMKLVEIVRRARVERGHARDDRSRGAHDGQGDRARARVAGLHHLARERHRSATKRSTC